MPVQPQRWRRVEAHGPGHPLTWIIWVVPALFFLYEFVVRIAPSLMVPTLQQELEVNQADLGGILGAYYYAYAPMQLLVGLLLDRFGSRRLLCLAAGICVAGLVVGAVVRTGAGLAASRFLLGFGSAFAYLGAVYVAMIWFPPHRRALLTGLTAGIGFAGAVGGEFLLALAFGTPPSWTRGMWILAMLGIGFMVALWLAVPERPAWYLRQSPRRTPHDLASVLGGFRRIMRNPQTWLISVGCGIMYLPLAFASNWGPRELHELLGFTEDRAPHVYALFFVGVGLGCPLTGWLSDRWGRRRPFLLAGGLLAALGGFGIALLPTEQAGWAWIILPLWGVGISSYVLGYPLTAELNPPDAAGSAIACVNFVGMLLAGIMVWLFGVVVEEISLARGHASPLPSDYRSGMLGLASFMILSVLVLLGVGDPRVADGIRASR